MQRGVSKEDGGDAWMEWRGALVHIEEDGDAGDEELELPLDGGNLVLPARPHVREKDVESLSLSQRELGHATSALEANGRHVALRSERVAHHDEEESEAEHVERKDGNRCLITRSEARHTVSDLLIGRCSSNGCLQLAEIVEQFDVQRAKEHPKQRNLNAHG